MSGSEVMELMGLKFAEDKGVSKAIRGRTQTRMIDRVHS